MDGVPRALFPLLALRKLRARVCGTLCCSFENFLVPLFVVPRSSGGANQQTVESRVWG